MRAASSRRCSRRPRSCSSPRSWSQCCSRCGSAGRCATPSAPKPRWCRSGFQARVTEAVLIVSSALRRAGAGRSVRRRAARDQGAEPAGRYRDHARRAHAADPPRRLHGPRLARQPHQGLGRHHHVRGLGRAGAARARLVRSAGAGARQRRHQCRQGPEDHAVVGAQDPVHRRRIHAGRDLDRALVRTAADVDAGPGAVACASASRSSRRRS